MRLLWLGSLHSDYALWHRKNANPAAAKWTRGLIGGLRARGVEVLGLSHCYEQLFPRGELFPGTLADFDSNMQVTVVRYPNIPGLKDPFLCRAYRKQIERILAREAIDAVLCYNTVHTYHVAAMRLAAKRGIPTYPIILDADDPRTDDWASILRETEGATGVVFVSDWAAKHFPGINPVLHLDGGTMDWNGDGDLLEKDPNLIVYTGGLDDYRGVTFLADVVRHLPCPSWRFLLCGKVDEKKICDMFGSDPRVEVRGFVSEEDLHNICRRANIFISMRPPSVRENIMNFPSKIPNYLSYGKPVVSTWIDSFEPEYRSHLCVAHGDSPGDFADVVETVMGWSALQREIYRSELRRWYVGNKLWSQQATRLLNWMGECVHG